VGHWVVPIGSSLAFDGVERTLYEWRSDPDLDRFAWRLQLVSYGVFGQAKTVRARGELPYMPEKGQSGEDFLKDGLVRKAFLQYFNKEPSPVELRSPTFSAVASSYIGGGIGTEIRCLGVETEANSTMWDEIRDCRKPLPPGFLGNELGKYRESKGEGFYVNDLDRGPRFREIALSQKGSDTKLLVPRDVRVTLAMVGPNYKLEDVGAVRREIVRMSFGSSRRLDNAKTIDELLSGKVTRNFVGGKDSLDMLSKFYVGFAV